MSYPVYYVEAGDTLPILFASYDGGTGASVTMTGLAVTDVEVYKDGSVTQRASDAGYVLLDTDGIDFDGLTGIHGISLDLSDDTDAGFYAVGSWYHVVVSSITVDAQTVSFVAAAFRVVSATRGLAGTALPDAAADAAGGLAISDAGGVDLDAQRSDVAAILVDTGTTLQAELDGIQADTEDLQTRVPAALVSGRIDASVGAMAADVMTAAAAAADLTTELQSGLATAAALTTVEGKIDTLDANVDTLLTRITGALFGGITSLAEWLGLLGGKQTADATARTEMRATGAGSGTYDETTDSHEALRDTQGTPAGASVSADVAAIQTVVDAVLVDTGTTLPDQIDTLDAVADAILLDTGTDGVVVAAASKAGYALSAAGVDALWDEARSGHATAGTFGESFAGIVAGVAEVGTLSITQMTSDLAEATDDHYIGRTIVWVTGVLAGQASDVTDYAGTTGLLTYTAITEAPGVGDRFVIV